MMSIAVIRLWFRTCICRRPTCLLLLWILLVKMDNVLQQAIKTQIDEYMKNNGNRDEEENPKLKNNGNKDEDDGSKPKKKPKHTENRLSSLLARIKGRTHRPNGERIKTKPKKHIHLRYQRFDPMKENFRNVKMSEGGGHRFIEWNYGEPLTFGEIRSKAIDLYFDDSRGCNFFHEKSNDCLISLCDASGILLDYNENIWTYLEKKGVFISKICFLLQSKDMAYTFLNDDDSLGEESYESHEELSTGTGTQQRICSVCACTVIGPGDCLICQQNDEFESSLAVDNFNNSAQFYQFDQIPDFTDSEETYRKSEQLEIAKIDLQTIRDQRILHFASTAPSSKISSTMTTVRNTESTSTLAPSCSSTDSCLRSAMTTVPNTELTSTPVTSRFSIDSCFQDSHCDHAYASSGFFKQDTVTIPLKIRRLQLREDLMKFFMSNKIKLFDEIIYTWIDPRGKEEEGTGSGVSRDVYSSFWNDVRDALFCGEQERVPYIRHDLYKKEWASIGRIMLKGYHDTNYFPTFISKAFLVYCLFGEVSNEVLINSFLNYLSKDESVSVSNALIGDDEVITSDEFQEFLEQFGCRTMVTPKNVTRVVTEIARQELIQKVHLMASCWKDTFLKLQENQQFQSIQAISEFYDSTEPTPKKVIALFKEKGTTSGERDSFGYLKRYVRGLQIPLLKKFLRFLTGADLLIVESIEVVYIKPESTFSRRPIAHTCTPVLELPSTYNGYCELREELSNILALSQWEMDIV